MGRGAAVLRVCPVSGCPVRGGVVLPERKRGGGRIDPFPPLHRPRKTTYGFEVGERKKKREKRHNSCPSRMSVFEGQGTKKKSGGGGKREKRGGGGKRPLPNSSAVMLAGRNQKGGGGGKRREGKKKGGRKRIKEIYSLNSI